VGWMGLDKWRRGLFTHEDKGNMHKVFGLPCLVHIMFRLASVPFRPFDDMGFRATPLTAVLLMWHLMLSLTSLIFRIPKVRIREGSRIWPEFRLHSIVFACRSLACLTILWLERRYDPHGEPRYWANVAVVFATLISADLATASVDPASRSNTIRGLDTTAAYKFAFSFMQFLGTTGCLVGLRAFAGQFAVVFIIQTYAFTLTLRRKNLLTHMQTVFIYSYQLTLGGLVAQIEIWQQGGVQALCMFPALACAAMLLRIGVGLNKYAVWAIMAALVQYARRTTPIVPAAQRLSGWPEWGWPVAAVVGVAASFGLFVRRQRERAASAAATSAPSDTDGVANGKEH